MGIDHHSVNGARIVRGAFHARGDLYPENRPRMALIKPNYADFHHSWCELANVNSREIARMPQSWTAAKMQRGRLRSAISPCRRPGDA
jgi:hypothetical protein